MPKPENQGDVVKVEKKTGVFDNPGYGLVKDSVAFKMGLFDIPLPIKGGVFGPIAIASFDVAENIYRESSFYDTVVDVGVDVGIEVGINFALQSTSANLAVGGTLLLCSAARQLQESLPPPDFAGKDVDDIDLDLNANVHFFLSCFSAVSTLYDESVNGIKQSLKPVKLVPSTNLPVEQLQQPAVSTSSSPSRLNVQFAQVEKPLWGNDWLKGSSVQPANCEAGIALSTSVQPTSDVKAPEIMENAVKPVGHFIIQTPPAPQPTKTFGDIDVGLSFKHGGIQAVITSTNNALNVNVDIGFGVIGVDEIVSDLVNRIMGDYYLKSEFIDAYGDKFRLELASIGGFTHLKNLKIRVYKQEGKKEVQIGGQHRFKLKEINISASKNIPIITKNFNIALTAAITQLYKQRAGRYYVGLKKALKNKNYDNAEQLTHEFYNRYSDMPGILALRDSCVQNIKKMHSADFLQSGKESLDVGDKAAAIQHFLTAQAIAPDNHFAAYELSEIARKDGNLPEAIAQMKNVVNYDASFVDHLMALTQHAAMLDFLKLGEQSHTEHDFNSAQSYFEKAHEASPGNAAPILALTKLLVEMNDLPLAIQKITPIKDQDEKYAEYLDMLKHNLAVSYIEKGNEFTDAEDYEAAKEQYKAAQELIPEHEAPTYLLAQTHERMNDLPQAISEMEKIAEKNELAKNYLQTLQKFHAANLCVDEAYQLLDEGKQDSAVVKLREAQALVPDHIQASYALAAIFVEKADYKSAIAEIRKTPRNPLRDNYLAQLQVSNVTAKASPILQSLAQVVEEQVQKGRLNSYANVTLRTLLAINHVHPQALIALPYLLAGDEYSHQAWSAALQQRLSAPVAMTQGVLAALRVMGVNKQLPQLQKISDGLIFAQQVQIGLQLVDDLNVLACIKDLNPASFSLATAIQTNSLALAINMLGAPVMQYFYERQFGDLAPETEMQCLGRDLVPVGCGALAAACVQPSLMIYHLVACTIKPAVKLVLKSYKEEAKLGTLQNARRFLISSDDNADAETRYDKIPEYKQEMAFKVALENDQPAAHFQFTVRGGNSSVASDIATNLLGRKMTSEAFANLPAPLRSNYINALQRARFSPVCEEDSMLTVPAKATYAAVMQSQQYGNTASHDQMDATNDINRAYSHISSRVGLFQSVRDFLIDNVTASHALLGRTSSMQPLRRQLQSFTDNACQLRQEALAISCGETRVGFGKKIFAAIPAINAKEEYKNFNNQYQLCLVLSFMYGKLPAVLPVFEMQSSLVLPKSTDEVVKILQTIVSDNANNDLTSLARVLLNELSKDFEVRKQSLLGSVLSAKTLTSIPQGGAASSGVIESGDSKAERIFNCFRKILLCEPNAAISLRDLIIAEFVSKDNQFHFGNELDHDGHHLVSINLLGLMAFSCLMHELTHNNDQQNQITQFKREIIDNILFHGYQPPFELMMARLAGCDAVSEDQAKQMLLWYGIDTASFTASEKIDLYVQMYRYWQQHFSNLPPTTTLGEMCRRWGRLIRSTFLLQESKSHYEMDIFQVDDENIALRKLQDALYAGADPDLIIPLDSGLMVPPRGTYLFVAIKRQWPKVVTLLCQYGANVDLVSNGKAPVQLATYFWNSVFQSEGQYCQQIILTLAEYGANFEVSIASDSIYDYFFQIEKLVGTAKELWGKTENIEVRKLTQELSFVSLTANTSAAPILNKLHYFIRRIQGLRWENDYVYKAEKLNELRQIIFSNININEINEVGESLYDMAMSKGCNFLSDLKQVIEERDQRRAALLRLAKTKNLSREDRLDMQKAAAYPGLLTGVQDDDEGVDLFILTLDSGSLSFFLFLLKYNERSVANKNKGNHDTILHYAMTIPAAWAKVSALIEHHPNLISEENIYGHTPLHVLMNQYAQNPQLFGKLLQVVSWHPCVSFRKANKAGQSPLDFGEKLGVDHAVLRCLAEREINTATLFDLSRINENNDAVKKLVQHGFTMLYGKDPETGHLLIHEAAVSGNKYLLHELLLINPGLIGARNERTGETAFHLACRYNQNEIVNYLLMFSAKSNEKLLPQALLFAVDAKSACGLDHAHHQNHIGLYSMLCDLYKRVLPSNSFVAGLSSHMKAELQLNRPKFMALLISKIGLPNVDIEKFVANYLRKKSDDMQETLLSSIRTAYENALISDAQSKYINDCLQSPKHLAQEKRIKVTRKM